MKTKSMKFGDLFSYEGKSKIKAGDGLDTGEYPFYTSSNVLSKYLNEYLFNKPSLVFGTGGMASIHYCDSPFAVSTDCLVAYVKDESVCDTRFVYNYILGNIHLLEQGFKGAGLKHISKSYINEIQIPLPPLAVQKHISEILDAAYALKRKDQDLLKKYDHLAQAIFIDMFGDPVKNEKGWEVHLFGEIFDTRLGKMLDAKKQAGNVKYKYLGNSNVQWFRFKLVNLGEMEFSDKEISTFNLRKGDVLICEGGEVGRAAVWNEEIADLYFQKAIHRARPKENNITAEYTVMLLWFFAKNGGFKDYVSTSTISHLTGEKLRTIPIPIPPYKEQLLFTDAIRILDLNRYVVDNSIKKSNELIDAIVFNCFNSELIA